MEAFPGHTTHNLNEFAANKTPKASAPRGKSAKTTLKAQKSRSKMAVSKETISRPVLPAEPTRPKPSGFFKELFD
jgi:hypothetical protein